MNPLFYLAAAFSFGAIAVTVHAFLTAEDGFEDEDGFHTITPYPSADSFSELDSNQDEAKLPPFISANHR